MQLTDKHISEFQALHLQKFGVEITKAEALEKCIRLVRLMEIILIHKAKTHASLNNIALINK